MFPIVWVTFCTPPKHIQEVQDMSFEVLTAIIIMSFEVLGFGSVRICSLMPTFWRNMPSPSSGPEVIRQGNRGLYRTWRTGAEGRESIRGRECGNGMQTNRQPSGRSQGGGWVWSGRREENSRNRAPIPTTSVRRMMGSLSVGHGSLSFVT
jgi:hypothetical protein